MVAAKHLDRHRLGLRLLGRLAPDVLDGDDRDDDLLRHGPAVDEASAADEVEQVRPLGNPELLLVRCFTKNGYDIGPAATGQRVIKG